MTTHKVRLLRPHDHQRRFIESPAKRKVIRAGRRGGKTVGMAQLAIRKFLAGHRVLYATPTSEQVDMFWRTVKRALREPIEAGVYFKNETSHIIELANTEQRIRAKTAWNADTLRGDYADVLILDEFQMMQEDTWNLVGAPMLLDNNGDAVFIYTPPSLQSRTASRAKDPQFAAKLFKAAQQDTTGRWAAFHFRSMDNPYISQEALSEIANDMSALAYRMEILAEDVNEVPGALWGRAMLEESRWSGPLPDFERLVVAIDPSATSTGDEAGIIVAGRKEGHAYVLADATLQGSPLAWAKEAVAAYHKHRADAIVAEGNNGGEMVALTIHTVEPDVKVKMVSASRGKQTRAEPVSALYEHGRVHHVGSFPALEDEMCLWLPGDASPNRMDALVWALTDLMLDKPESVVSMSSYMR